MVGDEALRDRIAAVVVPSLITQTKYQALAAGDPVSSPFSPELLNAIVVLTDT